MPTASAGRVVGPCCTERQEDGAEQAHDHDQLELRRVGEHGQAPARGLQHHALVDHGQLEVGVRIVHRFVARLGDGDDGERRGAEQQRRCQPGKAHGGAVARDDAQVRAAGRRDTDRERQQQGRLHDRCDGHLAAGTHAPERAAGIERAERQEEPHQGQQPDDQQQVADAGERHAERDERHQEHGQHHGRHDRHGHDAAERACRVAFHRAPTPPLREVAVGLPARTAPVGTGGAP